MIPILHSLGVVLYIHTLAALHSEESLLGFGSGHVTWSGQWGGSRYNERRGVRGVMGVCLPSSTSAIARKRTSPGSFSEPSQDTGSRHELATPEAELSAQLPDREQNVCITVECS